MKGIEQLTQYIEEQGVKEGYLLTFNFNKGKKYGAEWTCVNNKKIFEVMV